jgi:dephospho-CoA kinase
MITVGCTGGIGSGKSSVLALLEQRGAVVLSADRIAARLIEPSQPAYDAVVEHFGAGVVADDGRIDRRALASRVFSDADELAALEAIVHPGVHGELLAALARLREAEHERDGDEVDRDMFVVLELPLLAETGDRYDLDGVLVVDAPDDIVIGRLVEQRAMTADEARRRIAVQASSAERLRIADFVIVNVGTERELAEMASAAWRWIEGLKARHAD